MGVLFDFENLQATRAENVEFSRELTLLYTEDNLANVRLVQRILRDQSDVTVLSAMQGRLGVELAKQHRPSVVLLDLDEFRSVVNRHCANA